MTTEEATKEGTAPAAAAGTTDASQEKEHEEHKEESSSDEDPDLPSKVYAGNLSFETTESELEAHFQPYGKIKATIIVRSNGKHLGYGFVTFETVPEAEKAIKELNKTKLRERELNVQSAKSKAETKRKRRAAAGGFRGRRRGKGRSTGGGGKKTDEEGDKENTTGTEGGNGGNTEKRRGRQRRTQPRPPRPRGPPSTTTVFIANLPFSITDSTLQSFFTSFSLSVTSAHVVKGKGKFSKGFGFVELKDEEEQKKAVEVVNGKECEGRVVSVRVALERVDEVNGKEAEEGKDTKDVKEGKDVKPAATATPATASATSS